MERAPNLCYNEVSKSSERIISWWSSTLALKKQWKSNEKNEQAVEMWNVRELCAIVMYPNAQKELAGEAPHLEHHRTPWKKLRKSNAQANVKSAQILCYKDVS